MWAINVATVGDPPRFERIERARPVPQAHEVLVRLTAASLNYRDLELARRGAGRDPDAGFTPLSDGCGVVAAVGESVRPLRSAIASARRSFRTGCRARSII